jgi:hypothetical protein
VVLEEDLMDGSDEAEADDASAFEDTVEFALLLLPLVCDFGCTPKWANELISCIVDSEEGNEYSGAN